MDLVINPFKIYCRGNKELIAFNSVIVFDISVLTTHMVGTK